MAQQWAIFLQIINWLTFWVKRIKINQQIFSWSWNVKNNFYRLISTLLWSKGSQIYNQFQSHLIIKSFYYFIGDCYEKTISLSICLLHIFFFSFNSRTEYSSMIWLAKTKRSDKNTAHLFIKIIVILICNVFITKPAIIPWYLLQT